MRSMTTILRAVADTFGLERARLRRGGREWAVSRPRFLFMLLARREGHTLNEIGRFLDMDHTSVLHGQRRAVALIDADGAFALAAAAARDRLGAYWQEEQPKVAQVRSMAREWLLVGSRSVA